MPIVRVLENRSVSDSAFVLRTERRDMDVKAGQCFNLGVVGSGINREYSIYSGQDEPHFDFLIKEVQGGLVSEALRTLKEGDDVELDGPYGAFCLDQADVNDREFLLIGSGTGIAPFHSFVKTFPSMNYRVLHGVRHVNDLYDSSDYSPGRHVACVSKQLESEKSQRVTDWLSENPVDQSVIAYICGNRNMIIDTFELLRNQGLPGGQIYVETFF